MDGFGESKKISWNKKWLKNRLKQQKKKILQ